MWRSLQTAALAVAAVSAGSAWAATPAQEGDVVVAVHADVHTVEFKIVAASGIVGFTIPEHWGVVGVHSQPPVAVTVFQIADPADAGTTDSSNIAVSIYHLDTDKGRAAAALVGKAYGVPPAVGAYNGWTTYTSTPQEGATTYSLIDAARTFDDQHVEVGLRCAWPHLAAHAADYDDHMRDLCHGVLDSVIESPGPYTPQPGEIVREPAPAAG